MAIVTSEEIGNSITSHLRDTFRYVTQKSRLQVTSYGSFVTITSSCPEIGVHYVLGVGVPQTAVDYEKLLDPFLHPRKLPLVWFSGPYIESLAQNLEERGLIQVGSLAGLSLDLAKYVFSAVDIEIIPVATEELFQKWCDIHARTWNKSCEVTDLFFKGLNPISNQEGRCFLFLAKFQDIFVGCSLLDIQGEQAGCYWDCVLPEYRGRGIGTAMVHHRVNQAAEKGCASIVAQCLNSSLPLYLKAGFEKKVDMAVFRWDAN